MACSRTSETAPRHPATIHFTISFRRLAGGTLVHPLVDLPLATPIQAPCHCFKNIGVLPLTYDVFSGDLPNRTDSYGVRPVCSKNMAPCHLLPNTLGNPPSSKDLNFIPSASYRNFSSFIGISPCFTSYTPTPFQTLSRRP